MVQFRMFSVHDREPVPDKEATFWDRGGTRPKHVYLPNVCAAAAQFAGTIPPDKLISISSGEETVVVWYRT